MKKVIGTMVAVMAGLALAAQAATEWAWSGEFALVTRTTFSAAELPPIEYNPGWGDSNLCSVAVDGRPLLSSKDAGRYAWSPLKSGTYAFTHVSGTKTLAGTVTVTNGAYFVQKEPNPPMEAVETITITPAAQTIPRKNGGAAIITKGTGVWTAAASDDWLFLNASSGDAGKPVGYRAEDNSNAEDRVGYVYVAGHTFTVTQKGLGGATLEPADVILERHGGNGTVAVTVQDQAHWSARPAVDWISVVPVSGVGTGSVAYAVAPWNELSSRTGTVAIAGETFTVVQNGWRMQLESFSAECDFQAREIPIVVEALDGAVWSVTPDDDWITVINAGSGKGNGFVSISVAANPSYKTRTGTVSIGSETFTVIQGGFGSPVLSMEPVSATLEEGVTNGTVSVSATPDLPWSAKSRTEWLFLADKSKTGSGDGAIEYAVLPNPTLYAREGKVVVTPEPASGVPAVTYVVTQPPLQAAIDPREHEFPVAGGSVTVNVNVPKSVPWKVGDLPEWLKANVASSTGPGSVTLQAAANGTVSVRSATIRIAEQDLVVTQLAHGVRIEYDATTALFGKDGGMGTISVFPADNASWKAVSSDPSWLFLFSEEAVVGDGEAEYFVTPLETGTFRTGTITIGDQVVHVTQRTYDMTISPYSKKVPWMSGSGEVRVTPPAGEPWSAVSTAPWITLDAATTNGTGPGTICFSYAENKTGKQRTGKVIIAGEVFALTQGIEGTTSTKVPYEWLDTYFPEGSDYEATAELPCPNGLKARENYVAGLCPTNPASKFVATISVADDVATITWEPNLNESVETRLYKVWSKKELSDAEWHHPVRTADRFFRVTVELPNGKDSTDESGLAVQTRHKGVQLWENGPYWAETNIGAENPWDAGYYFWWGDTKGYKREGNQWVASDGSARGFQFSSGNTPTYGKDNATLQREGWITSAGNLAPEHDAACAHWGDGWRMPTADEIQALIDNTTTEWIRTNNVWGRLVKGKGAYSSASIFLPAAGYGSGGYLDDSGSYGNDWSSTPNPDNSDNAWGLYFNSGYFLRGRNDRSGGQSVRPLRGFAE